MVLKALSDSYLKTRLYRCWVNMRQRCNNPNDRDYHSYGGRGIQVCNAWNTYAIFKEWALSSGYTEDLTIDRFNVNGDYKPDNCRWITKAAQALNRRNNRGYPGVAPLKTGTKYMVQLRYKGIKYYLGTVLDDEIGYLMYELSKEFLNELL